MFTSKTNFAILILPPYKGKTYLHVHHYGILVFIINNIINIYQLSPKQKQKNAMVGKTRPHHLQVINNIPPLKRSLLLLYSNLRSFYNHSHSLKKTISEKKNGANYSINIAIQYAIYQLISN